MWQAGVRRKKKKFNCRNCKKYFVSQCVSHGDKTLKILCFTLKQRVSVVIFQSLDRLIDNAAALCPQNFFLTVRTAKNILRRSGQTWRGTIFFILHLSMVSVVSIKSLDRLGR